MCFISMFYINTTILTTRANRRINPRINLQIYFNHVVYGTSKYVRANIKIKLVGPTILTIPYIPCSKIATDS